MRADEPAWWYAAPAGIVPRVLAPVAAVWGYAAERRIRTAAPHRAALPVICVGNFTAGGTGKTPLAILLAKLLTADGERPAFLTRGYGGRDPGPRRVESATDTAADIGDEALLLARHAPVMVARNRAAGADALAALAEPALPSVIVMDDGLQNPGLAKDLVIAVVDGQRGFGNGRVIPAGPLRAPLAFQLALADAIVVNRSAATTDDAAVRQTVRTVRAQFGGPVLEAMVAPDGESAGLRGARVVALAGIGNPGRFHDLLAGVGAEVVEKISFRDHHAFTQADAAHVLARARAQQADIVTTEKDWVRLAGGSGALAELRGRAIVAPIRLQFEDAELQQLMALLVGALVGRRAGQVERPVRNAG